MNETGVRVVTTDAEREDAFAVRRDVFVEEQGVDEELEYDEYDEPGADATHFVAYDDGEIVGAARLREADPGVGKVERVVVAERRRGEDWGKRVMEAVEATAREQGYEKLKLHAQTRVEGFYESLNYESVGEEFVEADIPHVEMRKPL
ncbi:GNAT family N-acetyltransferase [Halopelagius longus]|uniref:GNAT family N-acetyltransferase n=1 Tax=Halopelagius longus TaxID=1236180 RepID=A0A1H0ZBH0_9EURY|nr:GNAT family N-acetyltransferase [Halopelagius longus]RDI72927.1 GNAT family N-acetyltransferase [Halopelagius longus]SDQ24825.1 Predicted N-acyltransferase, GNAT family [Halopelagius longus]